MAKQLEYFDFTNPRRSKYDWSLWTNGAIWQAAYADDFDCNPHSFINTLKNRAKALHRPVQCKLVGDDVVVFQFLPVQNGHSKDPKRKDFAPIPRPYSGED